MSDTEKFEVRIMEILLNPNGYKDYDMKLMLILSKLKENDCGSINDNI